MTITMNKDMRTVKPTSLRFLSASGPKNIPSKTEEVMASTSLCALIWEPSDSWNLTSVHCCWS